MRKNKRERGQNKRERNVEDDGVEEVEQKLRQRLGCKNREKN